MSAQAAPAPAAVSGRVDFLDGWERAVRAHGDAPALVTPSRVLTYRETDRLTDAWAGSFAGRGAGPGRIVGLAFGDPAGAVLGMLAALKSGAGFTVLDDRLPQPAREDLVRRVGAVVWAGDGEHAPDGAYVPDGADTGWTRPTGTGTGNGTDAGAPGEHDVAYVLFTSGSTGRPKGTVVERGSLARFAASVAERLALTSGDRWLQVASLGFDVVIEEVFPALVSGAAVVCRTDTEPLEPAELHALTGATGSTVVELSTQYWLEYARWLEERGLTTPPRLRTVVVGGERMDPGPYRAWQRRQPAALAHVYGLTECTVSSTLYTGLLPEDAEEVPLGSPLRDVLVTVRRDGRPVPAGESGEIHIGGPLVARGFLDDEEATRRRFVPDPYGAGPGARTYVTGDLGRFDEAGLLVFLGRADDQLKIRGHRLEPALVERALCESPDVDQAVVVPDPATGTALWAFTVPADQRLSPPPGTAPRLPVADRDALVGRLAAQLPDWAVPRILHRVAELPKTPHGKVDKRALAAWAGASGHDAGAEVWAQAVTEARAEAGPDEALDTVLGMFRDVLAQPRLGPDDNFFDHGGQSLLAMRLLARLREHFPSAAGLRASALFSLPTPRLLSETLGGRRATEL
ncbi:Dimodular nonribosomal peptide synthase [Streptomyces xanthophaeus]|uniref:amino acid adenylation domain-containing protein n=1 Tax=Streptomyces xanthophaeus TaxID=67385 RepID=UPI00233F3971|nr:amino acid adenylation domain-containing protein [Streptomyces xanthophaeus]WCD89144.1 Dimodular nonribosomal peptide synthase [Streptomyces xanthophaeus]